MGKRVKILIGLSVLGAIIAVLSVLFAHRQAAEDLTAVRRPVVEKSSQPKKVKKSSRMRRDRSIKPFMIAEEIPSEMQFFKPESLEKFSDIGKRVGYFSWPSDQERVARLRESDESLSVAEQKNVLPNWMTTKKVTVTEAKRMAEKWIRTSLKENWVPADIHSRLIALDSDVNGYDTIRVRYEIGGYYIQIVQANHAIAVTIKASSEKMPPSASQIADLFLNKSEMVKEISMAQAEAFPGGFHGKPAKTRPREFSNQWWGWVEWWMDNEAIGFYAPKFYGGAGIPFGRPRDWFDKKENLKIEKSSKAGDTGSLKIEFSMPDRLTLHEVVYFTFSVSSEETITFDLGVHREEKFYFIIKDKNHTTLQKANCPPRSGFGEIGKVQCTPEKPYLGKLYFDQWYSFTKPGTYFIDCKIDLDIECSDGSIEKQMVSQELKLVIEPRNPQKLNEICTDLRNLFLDEKAKGGDRFEALEKLSHIRDEVAVPYLKSLVGYRNDFIVIPAIRRTDSEAGVRALVNLIKEEGEAARRAEGELRMMKSLSKNQAVLDLITTLAPEIKSIPNLTKEPVPMD